MTDTKNIIDYWPFEYTPRQNQIKALTWLTEQDAKFLILEAPVGSGKSNIGITYSQYIGKRHTKHRGDSFILTPQRILQEQYEESFRDVKNVWMSSLYGKTNYPCMSKNATCEVGSLVKPSCKKCPHKEAKKQAKIAPDTVLNYKLALTSFSFTNTFDRRELMILDECHALEEQLVSFDALQITEYRSKKYKLPFKLQKDLNEAHEWLKDVYLPEVSNALSKMQEECEYLFEKPGDELTKNEIKQIKDMEAFADHLDEVHMMSLRTSEYLLNNFVLVWDKTQFQFKRLTGEYSFKKIVEPMANRFLFMSSTILDKDGFCSDLGIDPKDTAFLSLESEFDIDNRPVYYMPQMKMNYTWNQPENKQNRNDMLSSIKRLLEIHKGDSGIIHTANFQVAEWLVEQLTGEIDHDIFHHNPSSGDDRNSIIYAFISSPNPGVLISPSSTEGLDLKDDLGRFAIFVKTPFGYLGDQWIKRRMEMSPEWYSRRALIDIIQGGGRVVRGENDHGYVYILDGSFGMLYNRSYHLIPKWWREAYHTV